MKRFQALLLSTVFLLTGTLAVMNLPVKYLGVDTVSAATDTTSGATAASETPAPQPAAIDPVVVSTPAVSVSAGTESRDGAGQMYYTVVSGDNLTKIGKKYGVTYQEIAKANKIANPNLIFPNQVLLIPGVKVDVVSGASPKESADPKALVKGLSADGYWIFSILSNVTVDGDVNVDGLFYDKDDTTAKVYRKLALYAQDADHNVTAEYTLTVKNINVTSPNFRIQNGKVIGNIHVNTEGFELRGATVEGNLSFATQAQMDSAKLDEGTVTGGISVKEAAAAAPQEVDVVSGASQKESADPKALVKGLSADGYWIFSILSDVTVDGDINVDGLFYDKDDTTAKVYRKLALYAQDAAHNVTEEYTLTVKNMNVTSPNFRIQNGKVIGDIHVNAEGFELRGTTVEGNLTFATQAQMESAKLDEGTVIGGNLVKEATVAAPQEVDVVSGASQKESADPKALAKGLSAEGYWIFSVLSDVTVDGDINVDGLFYDKDDTTAKVYRKLALYAQDAAHNVTEEYTLTVKNINVTSPNFRIQNGKVIGDIYVNAEGFELRGATVEGDIYFTSQAQMDSALLAEGTITGEIAVK